MKRAESVGRLDFGCFIALACAGGTCLTASTAYAQHAAVGGTPDDSLYPPGLREPVQPRSITWPGARFSVGDAIVTGTGAAVALTTAIVPPQPKHFYGGVLFDEGARNALRLPTSTGRFIARDASDVILSLEATWPFFVDAVITTWGWRGSADAAAQMALVDAQALAIVTAVQGVTNTLASRERPYGRDCGTEVLPEKNTDCESSSRYRSFFSGHAAFAFTSAGLICVHHVKLGLLGSTTADVTACVVAYAGAAATATLRTVGDMHYASDILVGAVVGGVVGLAVPLWHYRRPDAARADDAFRIRVVPIGVGLGLGGTF